MQTQSFSIISLESQARTSCFLALLWQPGAHSLLLPCDPVSDGPNAARLCGAGYTIRCPQNEMGCFITSASGSCLPGIHIPAKGDTRPSSCLSVRWCASEIGMVSKAVHQETTSSLLCRDTGGETWSILSGMQDSRSDGNMPRVHFIPSVQLTFSQRRQL